MSDERELAGRVVELARKLAGAGAEAEVTAVNSDEALTRFANSAIHQNVAEATTTVRLRLHLDGRTAGGSTTVIGADGLTALVERTIAAARLAPPDPSWAGLTAPAPLRPEAGFDEATAAAGPQERAARVRDFVDAAGGLETAGFCRSTSVSGGFANSAGQSVAGRAAEAMMAALIARHLPLSGAQADAVAAAAHPTLRNWNGTEVGDIRTVGPLEA